MRILVISQNTCPLQNPRAFRTAELTERLAATGHDVTLYTVHGSEDYSLYTARTGIRMKDIRTVWSLFPNDGNRRRNVITKLMFRLMPKQMFPDMVYWYLVPPILRREKDVDLLITIAVPHGISIGAALYRKKHKDSPKVWIADSGDPFYLNPFSVKSEFRRKLDLLWCSQADIITIPTEESRDGYFPQFQDKIRILPQAFDFSKTPVAEYEPTEVPTFGFAGRLYPGIRDIHSFLDYLLTLRRPYRFLVYTFSDIEDRYSEESDGRIEIIHGAPRKDVILALSKCDFLINVVNPSTVQSPSKLIDYGIAGRPILDISNEFCEGKELEAFLDGDYSGSRRVENLDRYRIETVAAGFVELAEDIIDR